MILFFSNFIYRMYHLLLSFVMALAFIDCKPMFNWAEDYNHSLN